MKVDPITAEIVASRLKEIAASMVHALYHSGYSPILRESHDGTAGLTDAGGRAIVVGGGPQYHAWLYGVAVRSVLAQYDPSQMADGDAFLSNDPYKAGNSHAPDMVVVSPVFYQGRLVAFGVSIAHKVDIGGLVPGSSGAGAREIFHDGLLIPPVRFATRAGLVPEIEAIVRSNSRAPDMLIGDLRGQLGATRLGAVRFVELCGEYSVGAVQAAIEDHMARTRNRLSTEIAQWPDAAFEAEGFLDNDVADVSKPVRIYVRVSKCDRRLVIDFSGSAAQAAGPVNLPEPTTKAVSLLAVIAACDPTIPMNAGIFESVEFIIPPRSVVAPQFPATVNHYFPTACLAYSLVLSALGELNPGRAVAGAGLGPCGISIGHVKDRSGKRSVQYELMVTALGGTASQDGASIVMPMVHFSPNTPIEIIESEYPVIVKSFRMRLDSAGAGTFRGGIGFSREYLFEEGGIVTVRGANFRFGSWGRAGGLPPLPSQASLKLPNGTVEALAPVETRHIPAGAILRLEQSGGGGYGDPRNRERESVLQDVANGYVSRAAAEGIYGVFRDSE